MKVFIKNSQTLSLKRLLKRRKMSLKQFLNERGISTYEALKITCQEIGVNAPSYNEFAKTDPLLVTNPGEGIIVIDPLPIINEQTGKDINAGEISPRPALLSLKNVSEKSKPTKRRKKVNKVLDELGEEIGDLFHDSSDNVNNSEQ